MRTFFSLFREACNLKDGLERNMNQDGYTKNETINQSIFELWYLEVVKTAIDKSKLKKAAGVEEIPNKVLMSLPLPNVIFCLLECCFKYSIVPSTWYKFFIKPIRKSSKNDPRIPLNHRGISLLSTVCKLYLVFWMLSWPSTWKLDFGRSSLHWS